MDPLSPGSEQPAGVMQIVRREPVDLVLVAVLGGQADDAGVLPPFKLVGDSLPGRKALPGGRPIGRPLRGGRGFAPGPAGAHRTLCAFVPPWRGIRRLRSAP